MRRRRPEEQLQKSIVQWLCLLAPPWLFWHTPNGGARSKGEAGKMKGLGTLPGVPDLAFLTWRGVAFIELKAGDGGKLTDSQEDFRDYCKEQGVPWAEARSLDEVKTTLTRWGLISARGQAVMPEHPDYGGVVTEALQRALGVPGARDVFGRQLEAGVLRVIRQGLAERRDALCHQIHVVETLAASAEGVLEKSLGAQGQ